MSSTIKAAIQALKGRIADAYTAISAKGGTLPATQDSANLPTAIASIPSGEMDIVGVFGAAANEYGSRILLGGTQTEEMFNVPYPDLSDILTIEGNESFQRFNNIIEANFTNLTKMNGFEHFRKTTSMERLIAPELTIITSYFCFRGCSSLISAYLPKISSIERRTFFDCPKLIDITLGAYMTGSFSLAAWSPTYILNNPTYTDLVTTQGLSTNLEQLLYNIREHIAANLSSQVTATITFSSAVYAAIQADATTVAAFPASWTIASA